MSIRGCYFFLVMSCTLQRCHHERYRVRRPPCLQACSSKKIDSTHWECSSKKIDSTHWECEVFSEEWAQNQLSSLTFACQTCVRIHPALHEAEMRVFSPVPFLFVIRRPFVSRGGKRSNHHNNSSRQQATSSSSSLNPLPLL